MRLNLFIVFLIVELGPQLWAKVRNDLGGNAFACVRCFRASERYVNVDEADSTLLTTDTLLSRRMRFHHESDKHNVASLADRGAASVRGYILELSSVLGQVDLTLRDLRIECASLGVALVG